MTMQEKVDVVTQGETAVCVTRGFAAPPDRVWRAMTEPEFLRQWMGSDSLPMTHCESDLRPGGAFDWRWGNADGAGFGFSGTFQVLEPVRRMVHTEYFNGDTSSGARIETLLTPIAGGTQMTMTMRWGSAAERAAAIATGMTDGFDETYDRLAALLERDGS